MADEDLLRAALPAYEFDDVLGRGAWGIVVAAHHRRLDRPVAVKMLPLAFTQDDSVRRRFATEARLLAALDHPHIVRIHDYIEHEEICALVMERLTGGTLAERMQVGRMSLEQATAVQLAVLHGLEHAHQHGVLHRDVKPENLMFAGDGVLKITDFGIATVLGDQAERLTATGIAMGTPAYMAPEQIDESAAVGAATDIWAAAAVFYELLTGAVPYPRRGTLQASLFARTRDDPEPLERVAPEIPREISRAVMRALDRDPGKRFATSAEFADALEQSGTTLWGADWVTSAAIPVYRAAARGRSDGAATTGAVTTAPGRSTAARVRRSRRRRNVVVAGSAAVLVAAAATVAALAFGGDHNNAHTATGGVRWGSWVSNEESISAAPIQTSRLGPVPAGWGSRIELGINLEAKRLPFVASHFSGGTTAEIGFAGDPINGPSWRYGKSARAPAATAIRTLESEGAAPYVTYYVLRDLGRGINNDASENDVLKLLRDPVKMKAYWGDVVEFLKELGSLDQPIPVNLEPGVSSTVEASAGDARKVRTVVASSGVKDLSGLPDTFAGWTQAWVRLRHIYAPKVMLGYNLEPWAAGDFLVPFAKNYHDSDIPKWTKLFARYYATLGTKYDFINYVVAYGEAGKQTTEDADYFAHPDDFVRLTEWVRGLSQDAHTRVVLESVPMGNTIMAPMNNTKYHWRDVYAQWLLSGDWGNLLAMREAGAIGIVFGFGYSGADVTCPCDAANDGESQGVGPNATPSGRLAASSDDDGGYLHDRVNAYLDAGGLSLD